MFYDLQLDEEKQKYKKYLQTTGSLSNLFTNSEIPYLYYRAAENLFCLAFNAENLSRSDVSADAKKGTIGIGLKTFLHKNGNTLQKVAEFNAISNSLLGKNDDEIIQIISKSRNKRIRSTKTLNGLKQMIYHCVTRSEGVNKFYECNMDFINSDSINITESKASTIKFNDGLNEYTFNKSKSTLFQRFCFLTNPLDSLEVRILDDPFERLLCLNDEPENYQMEEPNEVIYLPLFSTASPTMEPATRSGLNQWNAAGRKRNPNEVYIPVPAWIHIRFPGFFPRDRITKFQLELPNGEVISSKMCQQNDKGLMSNPNKKLGKWLLRDVLGIPEGELVTREILNIANIDSAYIEKTGDKTYKINFASVGKYKTFEKKYNHP